MDYYLSFIDGDFENLSNDCYIDSNNIDYLYKCEDLKNYFGAFGYKNLRFSSNFDINENPNNNFFYVVKDIKDFTPKNTEVPALRNECIDYIKNYDNCFLLFIFSDITIKNYLQPKIDNFISQYEIKRNKVISFSHEEINKDLIDNIINNVDYNTFNIVYENWSEDGNKYFPNLSENQDGIRYRIQTGLFRFYNIFNKTRNVHIDLVEKYKNQKFFYFINGDQLDYHFKKYNRIPISNKVKKIFKDNENLTIIILNEHEYENKEFILYVNKLVLEMDLDAKRVFFITNNSKLQEYKIDYNLSINVFNLDFLLMFIANHMVNFGTPKFIEDKTGDFFMCHNRSPKPHRYALLCMLKKVGLLNHIDWSLIMGWYHRKQSAHNYEHFLSEFFNENDKVYYNEEIRYFNKIEIKKSKYEQNKTWFDDFGDNVQIEWRNVYEFETYEQSYFNIVTESCYTPREIHITEKSVKPFYFNQFPIFLASHNHVKYLRQRFGFDLFDDIINHDYDDEMDNKIRLQKVFAEINRIFKNQKIFVDYYKKNRERFEKNRQIVINIKNSKRDIEFFMNLKKF